MAVAILSAAIALLLRHNNQGGFSARSVSEELLINCSYQRKRKRERSPDMSGFVTRANQRGQDSPSNPAAALTFRKGYGIT